MKKIIICFFISCMMLISGFAQEQDESFEGVWASNIHVTNSTRESTFISISKMDSIHYLVISVSRTSDRYTYIGGGLINSDGVLVVNTDKGDVWTLSFGYSRLTKVYLGLSDLNMEEEFDSYVKVDKKLTQWPEKWK